MSLNKVLLIGNLGADPKVYKAASSKEFCCFQLATNESTKNASGVPHTETHWHSVMVFGTLASNCLKFLKKGRQVLVEGKLSPRERKDQQGIVHRNYVIIASNVVFLATSPKQGKDVEPNQIDNPHEICSYIEQSDIPW